MIHVFGTNHKQMPIAAREQLLQGGQAAATWLHTARTELGAREGVLLSTCNRVELYFLAPEETDPARLRGLLCDPSQQPSNDDTGRSECFYHHLGEAAAKHLFTIACGLDSMVLGEYEIMAQVKGALAQAEASGEAGAVLGRLFRHALRAGKRARRETAISSGLFSIGQCATRRAQEVLGDLHGKRVLIFGAGQIAQTTAKHLAAIGAGPVMVFSRTPGHAKELADHVAGEAVGAGELARAVAQADIVLGCTAAPHPVVRAEAIAEAMRGRPERPLVIVDLGVPRNAEPAVADVPGVHLFNLDDLEPIVAAHVGTRQAEIERVQVIVEEELEEFRGEHPEAKAAIAELRAWAEKVRQECLARAVREGLSDERRLALDYTTDLLVRKLLHKPIAALRQGTRAADAEAVLVSALRKLFDLEEE
jgi:glutamyl-tRNA reductase